MKLSEIIKILEARKEQYGDVTLTSMHYGKNDNNAKCVLICFRKKDGGYMTDVATL